MSSPSTDTVARALTATLSNHAADRQSAETLLTQLASHDDHPAQLLHLAASNIPPVSQAAALRLKNLVRNFRSSSPLSSASASSLPSTSTLSDAARANVRQHILHALSLSRATPVEPILSETMHWLVRRDFPARWPALLQEVSSFLTSGQANRVHAALIALRHLAKCYEFKTRNPNRLDKKDPNEAGLSHPREPLESIAAASFPILLSLYAHLDQIVASTAQQHQQPSLAVNSSDIDGQQTQPEGSGSSEKEKERDHAAHAQRLIVKTFWSCTQFILPPCLAEGDALDKWMTAFLTTMRRPCRPVSIDQDEELDVVPEWKTKKWIGTVLTRFLKRYGSPKKVPIEEPWAHTIAEAFKVRYSESATSVMLEVVSSPTEGKQVSRRVANIALDFIEEAIETAQLWAVIKTRVDTLLTRVVFSYLCFSEADEELWLHDPGEYLRRQYDPTEDLTSPRSAACNLLTKMADLRSKRTILPFLQHLLNDVLEPYAAAPVNSPIRAQLARQKVGAFSALAAVRVKLVSKKELADSLLSVVKQHVIPDLRSEFGFVRSEAAWLLGQISACGWEDFSVQLGEQVLRGCVALLEDSYVPVQASAASALQFLMDQDGASVLIEPAAPQLLERLLQLMDQMADGYSSLIPAVDKLVERYPAYIMPVSIPLVQRLIAAFSHSAQGILRDDGGDDEDDDLVFTAAQVLHLISSILSAVGEWEEAPKVERARLLLALEMQLQPLLNDMFNESHQVFVEELLDILGMLVVQLGHVHPALSPFLLSMIPKMAVGLDRWAADYAHQMLDAIEGYLTFATPSLLQSSPPSASLPSTVVASGCSGMACFLSIINKLWSDKFDSSDAEDGAKIAEWVIINIGKAIGAPAIARYQNQLTNASPTQDQPSSTNTKNNINMNNTDNAVENAGDARTRRGGEDYEKARDILIRLGQAAAHRLVRCLRDYEREQNEDACIPGQKEDGTNTEGNRTSGSFAALFNSSSTHLTLADRLFCVVMDCCFVDAPALLAVIGAQPLMHLVDQHTRDLNSRFDRLYAKKSVLLGLCGLLAVPSNVQGQTGDVNVNVLVESKPHLLRIVLTLHDALTTRLKSRTGHTSEQHDGEDDDDDQEGDDDHHDSHQNNVKTTSVEELSVSDFSSSSKLGKNHNFNGGVSPFMDMNEFYRLGDKGGDGSAGRREKDAGSDLDDDEDATNILEEFNERHQMQLHQLANGGQAPSSLGLADGAMGLPASNVSPVFLDYLDLAAGNTGGDDDDDDDDDVANVGAHALDDVDHVTVLVNAAKLTAAESWWSNVTHEQRATIETLVRKVEETQAQEGQSHEVKVGATNLVADSVARHACRQHCLESICDVAILIQDDA